MSVFSKVYENMMSKIEFKETSEKYNTDMILRSTFYSTVISSFEWGGKDFPKFIEQIPDYIEESLIGTPIIGGFISKKYNEFRIAPCFGNGVLQNNGLYDRYTCIYRNGEQEIIDFSDIELCFNNSIHVPSNIIIEEFINKCLRAIRSVDISLTRAGLPSVINCKDESKVGALISAIESAYNQNKPFHVVTGDWTSDKALESLTVFDDKATNILGLWDIFVRYKNLFYTTFGINNVEIVKNERLTQNESEANTEITRYGLFNDMYKHRKDFCRRVKTHFNIDIDVNINRNIDTVTELNLSTDEKIKMKNDIIAPYKEEVNEVNENEN